MADKGKCLIKLKRKLKPALIIAVGDGANDIPMLHAADYGIFLKTKNPRPFAAIFKHLRNGLNIL